MTHKSSAQDSSNQYLGFLDLRSEITPLTIYFVSRRLTPSGNLKAETDGTADLGYYLLPVYVRGKYQIRVEGPNGWAFDPPAVDIDINGEDPCSNGRDINFDFRGFSIMGKVCSQLLVRHLTARSWVMLRDAIKADIQFLRSDIESRQTSGQEADIRGPLARTIRVRGQGNGRERTLSSEATKRTRMEMSAFFASLVMLGPRETSAGERVQTGEPVYYRWSAKVRQTVLPALK